MKNKKRLFAVALCIVLALCLIGCGNKDTALNNPAFSSSSNTSDTAVAGMLIFSTNASVCISYNASGLAIAIEPRNAEGSFLLEKYNDFFGKSCEDVVADLVTLSIEHSSLTYNIVIKPVVGSTFPNADFLNKIISRAQITADAAYATTNAILVPLEKVDEYGYVDFEIAKSIVLSNLELESANTFAGDTRPDSCGQYLFYIEEGNVKGHYLLDATTCTVEKIPDDDPRLWDGDSNNVENFDMGAEDDAVLILDTTETPNATLPTAED